MTRTGPTWPILALALALAAPAHAQGPDLPFGSRVRLTWRDSAARYVGELRTVLGDTLVVGDSIGAPDRLVPMARLRSVEVYEGRRHGWLGRALGVIAGAAAGGWLGYHLWKPGGEVEVDGVFSFLIELAIQAGPTGTGILGGLIGAGILGTAGGSIDRRERWAPVRPERLRIGAAPMAGGRLGLGVSIAF